MIKLVAKDWVFENIDTVIFDKDGTFIDLHFFWGKITELRALAIINKFNLDKNLLNTICAFLGYNPTSGKMLSNGITAMYSRVKIIEIFTKKLEEIGVYTSESEIEKIFDNVSQEFNKNLVKYIKPIDDAINFIETLYQHNIKLGIVTSDSVETTKLTLSNYPWGKYFDVIIGRESTPETKESGIPTKLALKKLGAVPQKTIMIGDAPMDSISAKNAGIDKTILVATGQIALEELKKDSDFVLNSLKELKCLKI